MIEVSLKQGSSNVGLKSGVPIQKENEVPLGPEARGEEVYPFLVELWGLRASSASWALPAGSGFIVP